MSKHFRPWKIDETLLLPSSVQDYVPARHPSRFIVSLVRESLDLSELLSSYTSGRSTAVRPAYDDSTAAHGLCERPLFLAPDRQSLRRARRLHDDRCGGCARLPNVLRVPKAASAILGSVTSPTPRAVLLTLRTVLFRATMHRPRSMAKLPSQGLQ